MNIPEWWSTPSKRNILLFSQFTWWVLPCFSQGKREREKSYTRPFDPESIGLCRFGSVHHVKTAELSVEKWESLIDDTGEHTSFVFLEWDTFSAFSGQASKTEGKQTVSYLLSSQQNCTEDKSETKTTTDLVKKINVHLLTVSPVQQKASYPIHEYREQLDQKTSNIGPTSHKTDSICCVQTKQCHHLLSVRSFLSGNCCLLSAGWVFLVQTNPHKWQPSVRHTRS